MISISVQKELASAEGSMNLSVDIKIDKMGFYVLYGPSGAGKTSLLRIISGLMTPDQGYIEVNGNIWCDTRNNFALKPQRRNIGYVFQDYALFPNMTVKQNLTYALGKKKENQLVEELIAITELSGLEKYKPNMLSGGQQQRVALARAVIRKPDILLLDEPFSALDDEIRMKLQDYIQEIHHRFRLTTIMVSHEKREILKMADYAFVIQSGEIVAEGFPINLFVTHEIQNQFKAKGLVKNVSLNDEVYSIIIWMGNHSFKMNIEKSALGEISEGDEVWVISDTFDPYIVKMEDTSNPEN